MTLSILKGTALCGLSLLLAGAGSAASAQTYHHTRTSYQTRTPYQTRRAHERAAILRQKADYARAVAHGHTLAAERAHKRASEIRRHIRVQKRTHADYRR